MDKLSRPILRYHGGKWILAPWVVAHFPSHRIYTEPFGGAASVLMRKPRARLVDVYNDLDGEIVNLFKQLRDPEAAGRLLRVVEFTPFAREEFELSYENSDDPIEQARRTLVRSFLGFGSDAACGAQTGFRANGNRKTGHPAKDWSNYAQAIPGFCERLRGVVIENRDAIDVIRQHDSIESLHYCDPPYVHQTRSANTLRTGKGYRHEMSNDDHRKLADVLHEVQGMVVLSGYRSQLYDELYGDWEMRERAVIADVGQQRTEVLWLNQACADALNTEAAQKTIPL